MKLKSIKCINCYFFSLIFRKKRKIKRLPGFPTSPFIYLINYESEKFIVDISPYYDIDWENKDDWENDSEKKQNIQKILNKAAILECRISHEWPEEILIDAKRMIGEGIARSFWYEYDAADEMLKEAEVFINLKSQEISRQWTLRTCIVTTFILAIIGIGMIAFREKVIFYLGNDFLLLFLGSCCGGLGALLSVIFRIGEFKTQNSAGIWLHRTEGFSRILAGCICGFIASILIKTKVLFPSFCEIENMDLFIWAFATIAGASEKWIPNIIFHSSQSELKK